MISQVFIGITDFDRAFRFYSSVMGELGLELTFCEREASWAAWMTKDAPRPLFLISKPYDGNPSSAGTGQMVALLAPDRRAVDRAHASALTNDGAD